MGKNRSAYFDNLKGVLIILVVIGHLVEPIAASPHMFAMRAVDFIYLFHMPLFIFVSGLFSKSAYRDGKFRSEIVVYYLALCMILYFCLRLEKAVLTGDVVTINPFTLSGGSIPWYFMALAAYVLCIPFFARIRARFAIGFSIAVAVASGFYNAGDFLTISRILVYMPFFLTGYYLESTSITFALEGLVRKKKLWLARLVSACLLMALFMVFNQMGSDSLVFLKKLFTGRNSYITMVEASGIDVALWACSLIRLLYYVVVGAVALFVIMLVPVNRIPLLTRTGMHSLQVYFLHPFFYYALNHISFAAGLYLLFPKSFATFCLFSSGLLLALVLGAPEFPQRVFDSFKRCIVKAVGGKEVGGLSLE